MSAVNSDLLRSYKVGLFSERSTATEALEYAQTMFPDNQPGITTAIMVYHNTLLEVLAKAEDAKP